MGVYKRGDIYYIDYYVGKTWTFEMALSMWRSPRTTRGAVYRWTTPFWMS